MFGGGAGDVSEPIASSKSGSSEPKMYIGQEWHGWNLENVENLSKCARNSVNEYNPLIDYVELFEEPKPTTALPYTDYGESCEGHKPAISLNTTLPMQNAKGSKCF